MGTVSVCVCYIAIWISIFSLVPSDTWTLCIYTLMHLQHVALYKYV